MNALLNDFTETLKIQTSDEELTLIDVVKLVKEGVFALPDDPSTLPSGRASEFEPPTHEEQFEWVHARLRTLDTVLTRQKFLSFVEDFDLADKGIADRRDQTAIRITTRYAKSNFKEKDEVDQQFLKQQKK